MPAARIGVVGVRERPGVLGLGDHDQVAHVVATEQPLRPPLQGQQSGHGEVATRARAGAAGTKIVQSLDAEAADLARCKHSQVTTPAKVANRVSEPGCPA